MKITFILVRKVTVDFSYFWVSVAIIYKILEIALKITFLDVVQAVWAISLWLRIISEQFRTLLAKFIFFEKRNFLVENCTLLKNTAFSANRSWNI